MDQNPCNDETGEDLEDAACFNFKPNKTTKVVEVLGQDGKPGAPTIYGKLDIKETVRACWLRPSPESQPVVKAFCALSRCRKPLLQLAFAACFHYRDIRFCCPNEDV